MQPTESEDTDAFRPGASSRGVRRVLDIPRKEVIQPQVLLRLPCYDLVPVTEPGVGTAVLRPLRPFPAPMT